MWLREMGGYEPAQPYSAPGILNREVGWQASVITLGSHVLITMWAHNLFMPEKSVE